MQTEDRLLDHPPRMPKPTSSTSLRVSKIMPEVLWSCRECGIKDRSFQARERERNEDIALWMQMAVQFRITHDHRESSPLCKATEITTVKIKLPAEGGLIGTTTKN